MLTMRWNSVVDAAPVTTPRDGEDLQIRNLFEDPRLRAACGLDPRSTEMPKVKPDRKMRFGRTRWFGRTRRLDLTRRLDRTRRSDRMRRLDRTRRYDRRLEAAVA